MRRARLPHQQPHRKACLLLYSLRETSERHTGDPSRHAKKPREGKKARASLLCILNSRCSPSPPPLVTKHTAYSPSHAHASRGQRLCKRGVRAQPNRFAGRAQRIVARDGIKNCHLDRFLLRFDARGDVFRGAAGDLSRRSASRRRRRADERKGRASSRRTASNRRIYEADRGTNIR